jgi:hypothetical protein
MVSLKLAVRWHRAHGIVRRMDDETYCQPGPKGFEVIHKSKVVETFPTRHEAEERVRYLRGDKGLTPKAINIPIVWREES